VRQRQIAVGKARVRQRRDRVGERLTGVVGRAIVRDDDLSPQSALAEEVGACGEARRDPASLVIGR